MRFRVLSRPVRMLTSTQMSMRRLYHVSLVTRELHRIASSKLWRTVKLDLARGHMDITDDGSARNRAIAKQITTHTRHLILSIPGEDQPSTLPIFCSLLDSISFAALEAMEFVGSHLDEASWTALDTLLNGSRNVQFSESLRLLDLPYSTSNDAFQKCLERKSGEMFSCYGDLKFNIYKDGRPHKMQVGFRGLTPNW
jgi:hypothetical protein